MNIFTQTRKKYDRSFFLLLGLSLSLLALLTAFRWSSPQQLDRILVGCPEVEDVFQFVELSKNFEIEEEQKQKQRPKPNPQQIVTSPDPEPDPKPEPEPDPVIDPNSGVIVAELPIDTVIETELPFRIVEEMPVYPGGEKALFADVSKNFKVPAIDKQTGLEGTIHMSFVVNERGEITDVTVLRGLSPATDAEAVRAIQKLKRFTPGKQRGMAVAVIYSLPIRVVIK